MSIRIQEVSRLSNGTALSRETEKPGSNTIFIPFDVLWEQQRAGVIKLVHFSFSNLHQILAAANVVLSNPERAATGLRLNSALISATFGRTRRIQAPNSVEVTLQHLETVVEQPTCVSWNPELGYWSDAGCALLTYNATASVCRCDHMSVFSVASATGAGTATSPAFSIMTLQIVTYIVAAISVLCVVLILVKVEFPPFYPRGALFSGGEPPIIPRLSSISWHHILQATVSRGVKNKAVNYGNFC